MTGTSGGRGLRIVLLAVIGVGLLLLGGGLAVALGIGRTDTPSATSVDAGFARDMSTHHLQGVLMANLVAERSEDPEVRQLAFDISATQTNQAGRMQGWLALWGIPQSGGDTMAWMSGGDGGHDHAMPDDGGLMPGMATSEELATLRGLTGTPFDVEFLRLMIRHHQGGFEMAEYAVDHAELPAVRSLAQAISGAQTAETRTMAAMLTARGGTPLPAP
ncbi:DUF305 domain-containing protein [Blastococcus sp. TML/M2B]|uniref:DUF305 domain-containing protein n=1 Tax=unclassified Blastococcus TaxID=2619396 RepID=UPI00190AD66D|nr:MULTISPECIES: DUF305 domain-containing protein [unclassified Blastococcus]MBN1093687.1 DUF305 domain-containing protein [Blastococcus sp. TML/M2B]MBN1096194.1 DUF305 domain-containing protein [Blastococcus sp. TML/C7B]